MTAFLRNTWYLAGWAEELSQDALLARTIAGEPLVLFRSPAGAPVALADVCPHRFAPLSRGRLGPLGLQCRYHGLTFGADGRCVHNPHGPISSALSARRFAVVERHTALWIWLGEPDRADPATIPDLISAPRSRLRPLDSTPTAS